MNHFDQQWHSLTRLARQATDARDTAAPYGFATRLAAQAVMAPAAPWAALERFALRGLLVAGAFGIAAIAFNFSASYTSEPWDDYAGADIVAEMLDLS